MIVPAHITVTPIEATTKAVDALLCAIEGAPSSGAVAAYRAAITRHGRNLMHEAGPDARAEARARVVALSPLHGEDRAQTIAAAWRPWLRCGKPESRFCSLPRVIFDLSEHGPVQRIKRLPSDQDGLRMSSPPEATQIGAVTFPRGTAHHHRNDEDHARQLVCIDLSGLFLIERRIIDPTVCLAVFATALARS